jgi:hypothetical protein
MDFNMVAIITPNSRKENKTQDLMMVAADKAQDYMKRLFAGRVKAKCECGRELKYDSVGQKMACPECSKEMGVVGYITQYGQLYIRTLVDLAAKRFCLAIQTDPEKFEPLD